jgi:N-acetylmuramoyl-L-alanine amidase
VITFVSFFITFIFPNIISQYLPHLAKTTTSFRHIKDTKKSEILVIIRAGHGTRYKNKYLTAGKQSPQWPGGLKVYEGISCMELAYDLAQKLMKADIECVIINPYNTDMTLQEEVSRVNYIYANDKRAILLNIHHNAQPTANADYTDFEGFKGFYNTQGATGIESYTSPGQTISDTFNNSFIIPELEKVFADVVFRYGSKTKGKEANFTVLTATSCPSILVEWMFMTTYWDCNFIANETKRDSFTTALCRSFIKINQYQLTKKKK